MGVFLFFVDGLGIGKNVPKINPCCNPNLACLNHVAIREPVPILCCGWAFPVDATLTLGGLPQSATGQTTLLTGINAPRLLGHHLPGFPNKGLRSLLKEYSIFRTLHEKGFKSTFLNAYRPPFFELKPETQWRLSATTGATLAADLGFRTLDDVREKRAVYHDITNAHLIEKGFDVPRFTASEAADIVIGEIERFDFILFEYFLTDRAGHKQNGDEATRILSDVDTFLKHIVERMDLKKHHVILTSDHGNIEDLSVKTHTLNPAMTLVWGKKASRLATHIRSLVDIKPAILSLLEGTVL